MGEFFLESWPFLVVVGALAVFAVLSRRASSPPPPPGFARRRVLWEGREKELFRALRYAVGTQHLVLSKVRLGELVDPLEEDRHDEAELYRIDAGHVDFLLCHPDSLQPQLVVQCERANDEVPDDPDESGDDDQPVEEPDCQFVSHVLGAAGIPCVAVSPDDRIEVRNLRRLIRQSLSRRRSRRRAG
jgi:hypothetical protein